MLTAGNPPAPEGAKRISNEHENEHEPGSFLKPPPATLEVEILVAEDESPVRLPRTFSRDQESARMAKMNVAGGRRREAATI